jgi:hypothetical protein
MKVTAELVSIAAAIAVGSAVERWATPWADALLKKGFTVWQANRFWAIMVVGSGAMTWVLIEPFLINWLK